MATGPLRNVLNITPKQVMIIICSQIPSSPSRSSRRTARRGRGGRGRPGPCRSTGPARSSGPPDSSRPSVDQLEQVDVARALPSLIHGLQLPRDLLRGGDVLGGRERQRFALGRRVRGLRSVIVPRMPDTMSPLWVRNTRQGHLQRQAVGEPFGRDPVEGPHAGGQRAAFDVPAVGPFLADADALVRLAVAIDEPQLAVDRDSAISAPCGGPTSYSVCPSPWARAVTWW